MSGPGHTPDRERSPTFSSLNFNVAPANPDTNLIALLWMCFSVSLFIHHCPGHIFLKFSGQWEPGSFWAMFGTYLLQILCVMIAWLILGDVWDFHTPYISSKTSFLCQNFTFGRHLELNNQWLGQAMIRPPGAHFSQDDVKDQNTPKFHHKHYFYATIYARQHSK